MDMLLLDQSALEDLARRNDEAEDRQLSPVALADGRQVLNADLLGDCGPEGTWARYADLLDVLPVISVAPDDWPQNPG